MRRFLVISAAAAALGAGYAGAQQQRERQEAGSPQQQLEEVKQRQLREFMAQGGQKVEVRQSAIWGLGELPPTLMHRAMEALANDPEEAVRQVMQAGSILELQSALAQGEQAERLRSAANDLRDLSFRIHFRQVLTQDQLKPAFAQATLAAARYYQAEAQEGLRRNDEEKTGYSLKAAADYLSAAHTFAGRQPTPQVSLATYNARTVAEQIIQNSRPTSYDAGDRPVRLSVRPGEPGQPEQGAERGQAESANIPHDTERIVRDLQQAIQQASNALPAERGPQ